jgi:hypothetical protein
MLAEQRQPSKYLLGHLTVAQALAITWTIKLPFIVDMRLMVFKSWFDVVLIGALSAPLPFA